MAVLEKWADSGDDYDHHTDDDDDEEEDKYWSTNEPEGENYPEGDPGRPGRVMRQTAIQVMVRIKEHDPIRGGVGL
jgi:hypothetical protein